MIKMRVNQLVLVAVAALPSAVSAASIYEIAANATDFSTLGKCCRAVGLLKLLNDWTLPIDYLFTISLPLYDGLTNCF